MKITPQVKEESRRILADMQTSSQALSRVLPAAIGADAAEVIGPHLSDLYASAGRLRELIERLGQVKPSERRDVRSALLSIETELYEVLERHRTQLKEPLTATVKRLFAEEKGERTT